MSYGQVSHPSAEGTSFFHLLGQKIENCEFKDDIVEEKSESYPKHLVFNYRISDKLELQPIFLYGSRVRRMLLNIRNEKVSAINFLINGDSNFWENLIKSLGHPSSGSGIGIQGDTSSSGTFFWKISHGCIAATFGRSYKFGEIGQFTYNILFTLFDCDSASVLPQLLKNLK